MALLIKAIFSLLLTAPPIFAGRVQKDSEQFSLEQDTDADLKKDAVDLEKDVSEELQEDAAEHLKKDIAHMDVDVVGIARPDSKKVHEGAAKWAAGTAEDLENDTTEREEKAAEQATVLVEEKSTTEDSDEDHIDHEHLANTGKLVNKAKLRSVMSLSVDNDAQLLATGKPNWDAICEDTADEPKTVADGSGQLAEAPGAKKVKPGLVASLLAGAQANVNRLGGLLARKKDSRQPCWNIQKAIAKFSATEVDPSLRKTYAFAKVALQKAVDANLVEGSALRMAVAPIITAASQQQEEAYADRCWWFRHSQFPKGESNDDCLSRHRACGVMSTSHPGDDCTRRNEKYAMEVQ